MTLLDWLTARYPTASRTTLRRMLDLGRIRINGQRARSMKQALRDKDDVHVTDRASADPDKASAARAKSGRVSAVGANSGGASRAGRVRRPRLPFAIIHEDDDVLVIDKPPGLITSTVPREPRPTALAAVTEYLALTAPAARVGVIHRLDRDASGLLVFSKNPSSFRSLKKQFFEHTVERIYHAIVQQVPNPRAGRIETRLVELPDGSVHTTRRSNHGEPAITEFKTIRIAPDHSTSLLRIKLHTGRKHQIRVHLSERGTPIVNDPVYGKGARKDRLMLVATELAFDHPVSGARMRFELPLPKELTRMVAD